MLMVLLSRWQVLSFWSNFYVDTSQNKLHVILVSFYHAIYSLNWLKGLQKKERGNVCFCLQWQGQRSRKHRLTWIGLKNWWRVIRVLTSTRINGWKSWTSNHVRNVTCQIFLSSHAYFCHTMMVVCKQRYIIMNGQY